MFDGNHISRQLLFSRCHLPYRHDTLAHRRMFFHHRLHLARFHPVAADLDLAIHTSHEFDGSVRRPAAQVAGAVKSCGGIRLKRVWNEPRGR